MENGLVGELPSSLCQLTTMTHLLLDQNDEYMFLGNPGGDAGDEGRGNEDPSADPFVDLPIPDLPMRAGNNEMKLVDVETHVTVDEVDHPLYNGWKDPFNASNDMYYQTPTQRHAAIKRAKPDVVHSLPAVRLETFPLRPTDREIRNFHRPRLGVPSSQLAGVQIPAYSVSYDDSTVVNVAQQNPEHDPRESI